MGDGTVPQNGILGPRTRRAIAAFQTEQQLAATGVLDNDTIAALQAACAPQDGGEQTGDGQ
jgi:peptidoglycan hydrolase-like protein with peptidoglycan-binding domain